MALVAARKLRCGWRNLPIQQCRGIMIFNVDEMVKKIAARGGTSKQSVVSHLLGVEGSKPYEIANKHSEYGTDYVMKPLDRKLKRKQIFIELTKAWQTKTLVDGTVLNVVRGGYAVAIGGFVAFMPRSVRKTFNVHSKFYIMNIKDNSSLVVGEADGTSMSWSKLFRFYKRSLQRLNMTVWIRGTVVSFAKDGYCVAIAGHVAFLPKAYRKSRKLDSTFRIMAMYPRTGKIVVQEVNTKYFASLAASPPAGAVSDDAAAAEEEDVLEEDEVEQIQEELQEEHEEEEEEHEGEEEEDAPNSENE